MNHYSRALDPNFTELVFLFSASKGKERWLILAGPGLSVVIRKEASDALSTDCESRGRKECSTLEVKRCYRANR